jgi:prepilin-type processing-associated H-X9-DG protein
MSTRAVRARAGFTFVELFVVIAIIGLLVMMLVVGVTKAREAAKRAECLDNLRQIGIACHLYHNSFNLFPSENGTNKSLYTSLLSYLEQANLDIEIQSGVTGNTQAPIKSFLCPSRRNTQQAPGKRDYVYALSPNNGSIFDVPGGIDMISVSHANGTANTLFLSHAWMTPANYANGQDPTDVGWFDYLNNKRTINNDAKLDSDPTGTTSNIGSPHVRYMPCLFADGHVQALPYTFTQWAQVWDYTNTTPVTLP